MDKMGRLIHAMSGYYAGDARRISHFLKVYGFAKAIGELEGLNERDQFILEAAALTHDIGIKNSELKYGSSDGRHQQMEGPPEAEKLLSGLEVDPAAVARICWLIARHHTYTDIIGIDYQILVEADFLVNIDEDKLPPESVLGIRERIFSTESGKRFLRAMYGV